MTDAFTPTDEQVAARDLFMEHEDSVAVEALAGTGKTSTLRFIARSVPHLRFQYVAFNKAIVTDAVNSMPENVVAQTAHSLAFRAIGHRYAHRLNSKRIRSAEVADRLSIHYGYDVVYGTQKKPIARGYLASHVMRAALNFSHSADPAPTVRHFPYIEGIDPPGEGGRRTYVNNNAIAAELLPALQRAWADLANPHGILRFDHSHYLKVWQLGDPRIDADVILFDEAQDANPVLLDVVERQDHAQRVWVGDSRQCQPSGTMVTVVSGSYRRKRGYPTPTREVPIEEIRAGDQVVSFDVAHSFLRRTGRRVRAVSARPYDGWLVTARADGFSSSYTPEHRCVARVGDALVGKHVVYMMRRGGSYRIGRATGVYESQKGLLGISGRAISEGADGAWILSVHETVSEAALTEMMTAWSYGIPTLRFRQGTSYGMTQADLDAFWEKMNGEDLHDRAVSCLRAHGLLVDHPFCSAGRRVYRNRAQTIIAANLLDGMLVLPVAGAMDASGKRVCKNRWARVSLTRRYYRGTVHSLDVEIDGTYIADGIVTHNSIYEWLGAVDALSKLDASARAVLTLSFRFGHPIAELANLILGRLGETLRVRGHDAVTSRVGRHDEHHAVLTRTNARAVRHVLAAQQKGIAPHLVGGGKEVAAFARGAKQLMAEGWTSYPDLACFSSWGEVDDYVQSDPSGSELALNYKLVEEFGVDVILKALDAMTPERDAGLIVSTAHKAKGREWRTVLLSDDFARKVGVEDPPPEELRLLYVAATRARHGLDDRHLRTFYDPNADEPEDEGQAYL